MRHKPAKRLNTDNKLTTRKEKSSNAIGCLQMAISCGACKLWESKSQNSENCKRDQNVGGKMRNQES